MIIMPNDVISHCPSANWHNSAWMDYVTVLWANADLHINLDYDI